MDTPAYGAHPDYAELQCASNFSFLQGASHAEELVARASQLAYTALAITDECSLAGIVRAHLEAKKIGLPLIVGAYFRLTQPNGDDPLALTALAMNRNGYGNLSEFITLGRMRSEKGKYQLFQADLDCLNADVPHLHALPDCVVILNPEYPANAQRLHDQLTWFKKLFGTRAWVALTLHARALDDLHRDVVQRVSALHNVPMVATGAVLMHVCSRKPLQDMLTAIQRHQPVHACGYELAPNAEQHLRTRTRLALLYPRDALEETTRIARQCQFSLDELRYEYPQELVPAEHTPSTYLRQETYIGAHRRFPSGIPPTVQQQLEHELALIESLRYEPYFLTVYDVVTFARSEGILCQGRGSAANSAVCYCLGVTEVDPARSSLLFERFISQERNEPPDIDIDFEHQRREEVMQYIYRKYGRERTALTAAVTTYRPRSALRDAGKALGIDALIVDRIAKSHQWFDSRTDLLKHFAGSGLDTQAPMIQQWATLATALLGFPRHLSQHSGGFVISQDRLSRLVPIENAAMPDRSIIQWDKDDIDALGLLKIDILALGMLSAIRRTLELIAEKRGEPFELQDIPAKDEATYDMMCNADTVGVFQIESRAQMSMLPRLRPRCFYDLVIEVALVRPGPMQGGMVHPYLRRREGLETVTYPSDAMKTALARTLGVPIFQEQVMQVAMLAAGFSAGEADQLRRAMAAWRRKGGLGQYYDRIVNGMIARGYDRPFAEAIFAQIQGFGEYGFPESHAASFALLVYASAWLKCHEPAAFLCALLNSQPMGFYTPSQLVQDARRHGVEVLPVDITVSHWDSTLEGAWTRAPVRLGLSLIRGMKAEAAARIELARAVQSFTDVADLARRAALSRHDLQALAAANALASLAGNRRAALWHAMAAVPDSALLRNASIDDATPAFAPLTEGQTITHDYRALGLTLGRHPLALLRTRLLKHNLLPATTLAQCRNGQLVRACGIVAVRQRPGTAKGVMFVTLEDETGQVNVIVWPSLLERQRNAALNATLLAADGVWQRQGSITHLVAKRLVDLSHLLGTLSTKSRSFR
ncbi:DNA polymerase III, alpha subunit [Mycoavidus cysteinexigens]|uniref:Error-prone DNA polymerase n=1 Tax=Mycoavidus cysteinexigens TaxID=1553431 RepID=A0A2Z6EUP8_9BURK|nr:error-prone DNA polymerase [Mycoavidus cysteinexigens]BBE09189.1 DNA polymerase III, alpha subunit [Mycoavidus cysteinexigens]GAM52064.1 DNA polymerase III alpha subunit [bacterium endosymbiont of Mortierella elongata FMR23-6]GLR01864.1 error-prone DNA polymerase [Mycoavidus cysteinexigens]